MPHGARTPEELETLLEDAFVVGDHAALCGLFDEGALLVTEDGRREARGTLEIARMVVAIWESDRSYVADPTRVVQSRDTALVVAAGATNVMRRGGDGAWRYAIAVLSRPEPTKEHS